MGFKDSPKGGFLNLHLLFFLSLLLYVSGSYHKRQISNPPAPLPPVFKTAKFHIRQRRYHQCSKLPNFNPANAATILTQPYLTQPNQWRSHRRARGGSTPPPPPYSNLGTPWELHRTVEINMW